MTMQQIPTKAELRGYEELCSAAFSRATGVKVDVTLEPIKIPTHVTKSTVFGAQVTAKSDQTVNVPSKIIAKRYIEGRKGVSDKRVIPEAEFRVERSVLGLDLKLGSQRIFPELYSKEVPECDAQRIILREFVTGQTLEELSQDQNSTWASPLGHQSISDALYPIALLHVKSPVVASALYERGLFPVGSPAEAMLNPISSENAKRIVRRLNHLCLYSKGQGINRRDKGILQSALSCLDRKFVTIRNNIAVVNGDLDVFPHHVVDKRLPDAGSVEIGGISRDLAVYSAPALSRFWKSPAEMAQTVLPAYTAVRGRFEDTLQYPESTLNTEILNLGLLLSSALGNLRAAAATSYYQIRVPGSAAEEEARGYILQAHRYLDAFIESSGRGSGNAKEVKRILGKYRLTEEFGFIRPRQKVA